MAEFRGLSELDPTSASTAASELTGNPEEYVNREEIEVAWAMKAFQYAETHMKLIQSVDAKNLKMTQYDDELHELLLKLFPTIKLDCMAADELKSAEAKAVWRPFCNSFENKVDDFNFGTLLRLDVKGEYNDENTILVPRVQFLAIEVTRNRSGLNSLHCSKKS